MASSSDELLARLRMLMEALGDAELSEHAAEGLRHLIGHEAPRASGGVSGPGSLATLHTLVRELVSCACARVAAGDEDGDGAARRRRIESLRLVSLAIELHRLPAVLPLLSWTVLRLAEACASNGGFALGVLH